MMNMIGKEAEQALNRLVTPEDLRHRLGHSSIPDLNATSIATEVDKKDGSYTETLDWNQGKGNHLKLSERAAEEYDTSYANANYSTGLYMCYELDIIDKAIGLLDTRGTDTRTALDLGCGTGRDSFHFNQRFSKVIGYDFSPSMVRVAERNRQARGIDNVTFVQKDIDTDFLNDNPDDSVAFINSGFGMGSFIQNIDGLLTDINRVLRPGGVFTVSFYNANPIVNELPDYLWRPSLSATIDAKKGSLHVNFDGNEFDVAAKAYTMQEVRGIVGRHLDVQEVASFPTLAALLPNKTFESPRIKRLVELIDYNLRSNEDIAGGAYITAICKKRVGSS